MCVVYITRRPDRYSRSCIWTQIRFLPAFNPTTYCPQATESLTSPLFAQSISQHSLTVFLSVSGATPPDLNQIVPSPPRWIIGFVAYLFNYGLSPTSIASHLSAIVYVHKLQGAPDPIFVKKTTDWGPKASFFTGCAPPCHT